jgi:enterochelin esterase family protein
MTGEAIATNSAVLQSYRVESIDLFSEFLDREVKLDIYLPVNIPDSSQLRLMLVNDGQDLPIMPFAPLIDRLLEAGAIEPMLVVGIYCSADRKLEYGTADELDYMNRGSRAKYYRKFILRELLPWITTQYRIPSFKEKIFAGFSLGGLSALDIAWKHPEIFSCAGVFSGSFWWRSKDLKHGYVEETDRIMHKLIRQGRYHKHLRFFFETGSLDETMDRNNNGIIDSIDDTLSLIEELKRHGYKKGKDIMYLELEDGRHDVPTWARAFPEFLCWACGKTVSPE